MSLLLGDGNISESNFSIKTHTSKTKLKCFNPKSAQEIMTWFNYPSLRFEANDYTTNNLTTANTTNKIYWIGTPERCHDQMLPMWSRK